MSHYADKIAIENLDFPDFASVQQKIVETRIFDYARYIPHIPEIYNDILVPSPPGVYLHGSMTPVIDLASPVDLYSVDPQAKSRTRFTAETFEQVMEQLRSGKIITNLSNVPLLMPSRTIERQLLPKCSFPYSAIRIMEILIYDYLRSLNRMTGIWTTSNAPRRRVEDFVLPEYVDTYYETKNRAEELILNDISKFTLGSEWNNYSIAYTDRTITIHKHLDYRTVQYYAHIFDRLEDNEAHDTLFSTFRE